MLGAVVQALLRPVKSQPVIAALCFGWGSAWLIDELVHRRSADDRLPAEPDDKLAGVSDQDVISDGIPPPHALTTTICTASRAFMHARVSRPRTAS